MLKRLPLFYCCLFVVLFSNRVQAQEIISTIAGTGTASYSGDGGAAATATLNFPNMINLDASNNLYICDNSNNRVRMITASTGVISLVAGNGTTGTGGDGGPATACQFGAGGFNPGIAGIAVDGSGNIYVSDGTNNKVRKIDGTGTITTFAGTGTAGATGDGGAASAAQLSAPRGLAVDASGNLYIADAGNNKIRKVTIATGNISTIAGTGTAGATGDGGAATAAQLNSPRGVAVDASGNVYIADRSNNKVRKITISTGNISTIAGTGTGGFTGDGGAATAAQINRPSDVKVDVAGNVFFADNSNGRIRMINTSGIISTVAGAGGFGGAAGDGGLATASSVRISALSVAVLPSAAPNSWFYISDQFNNRIREVRPNSIPYFTAGSRQSLTMCQDAPADSLNSLLAIIDSDKLQKETWSVASGALHGTLVAGFVDTPSTGGTLTPAGTFYIPTPGYSGADSFIIQVTDGFATVYDTFIVTITAPPSTPAAITGITSICVGSVVTLSDATPSGVWSSSTPPVATIDPATGVVNGISLGTTIITYTVTNSCGTAFITTTVNVGTGTGSVSGPSSVCIADAVVLSGTPTGGTWSSPAPGIITVGSSSGLATGISAGTATITYNYAGGGCNALYPMTVNPLPSPIAGTPSVCVGATTTLTDAGGGTWLSALPAVATVGSATGIVTGVSAGNVPISYSLSTGCFRIVVVTVNALPSAITPSGAVSVCVGGSTTLADGTPGGTWSSGATGTATVGTGGVVTGVSTGTVTISYTNASGCSATKDVTVTAAPAALSPVSASVCVGGTTTFTEAVGGGIWSSSSTGVATVTGGVVTGVTAGVATISYTLGSCSVTAPVTVNALPAAITPSGAIMCAGGTATLSDGTPGGTWSSGAAGIATVGTGGLVTGISAGTATISYTNALGCSATTVVTVSITPSALSPASATVCPGTTATFIDGVGGGTWSSSATGTATVAGGIVTGVAAGTAIVTYTIGSCFVTAPVTVNPIPVAGTISGATIMCTGGTTTLTDAAPGGVWSSSNVAVASVGSAGLVTGITAGVVTISYSVTNSCGTVVATHTMTVNTSPVASPIIGASMICAGTYSAMVDATPGGVWSVTNGNASISSGGLLTGIIVGADTVVYTITNTCGTVSVSHPVTVGPYLSAGTISGPSAACVGSAFTLSDPAPMGVWSSSNTSVATVGSTGVVTPLAGGVATISYTVTSGCGSAVATQIITVTPMPDAGSIAGPVIVCAGSITFYSNTATGGTWSVTNSSGSISSLGMFTAISSGIDTIRYTVTNSCGTAVASTAVTIGSYLTAGAISGGSSTLCAGSSMTLTDTVSGGVWSASNGNATVSGGVVTGVAGGTDTIYYTVSGSCGSVSASATVVVIPIPDAGTITGPTDVCVGSSITLADAAPLGFWSASNGNATVSGGVVTGVSTGTDLISYTVTNMCGSATATSLVTISTTPSAGTITGASSVCAGASVTLTDATPGGTWSASNGNATVSGGVVTGVTAGADTIIYTVTTACGTASTNAGITINPLPDAGAVTGISSVCTGGITTLTDLAAGGTWSASNSNATVSGGIVTGVTAGVDTIAYTVTNGCGTAAVMDAVTVNPLASAGTITGPSNVCVGVATALTDAATGGVWSTANGNASVDTIGLVTGIAIGTDTVLYTVTTACGTDVATMAIDISTLPSAGTITGAAAVCKTATITLTDAASGGVWSSANGRATVAGGVVTGVSAGADTISYTVSNICGSASAAKAITVIAAPSPGTISGPASVCSELSVALADATPGGVWSSSNTSIATVTSGGMVSGITAGAVTISYTTSNSCGSRSATHAMTILSHDECNTGVHHVANTEPELKVFPNPNKGAFTLNLVSDNDEQIRVVITNVIGNKVKEFITTTNHVTDVQLNNAAGIYLLSVSTSGGKYVEKVIVE